MSQSDSYSQLNERARLLLKTLVERYIRDGQPVGSRILSRDSGLDLSPATVRNVMSDLEDLGLLVSPHTSAGRIPTAQGYRFFIDSLLTVEDLEVGQVEQLREQLDPAQDAQKLLTSASNLLSDITQMAGIVMLPRHESVRLRQVEFLTLSEDQVLVIMVVNDREVQNRIIRTGRTFSDSELQQASNYLNDLCAGKSLEDIRRGLIGELHQARRHMNEIMVAAIKMADEALKDPPHDDDVLVAGQTNLMVYGELADMERLRQLFDAFNRKRDILHLLDQSLSAQGIQIFIGEESGSEVFEQCSLVTAPYGDDRRVMGVLGVIGPTRMAYERVIPLVDVTARLLGAALNPRP